MQRDERSAGQVQLITRAAILRHRSPDRRRSPARNSAIGICRWIRRPCRPKNPWAISERLSARRTSIKTPAAWRDRHDRQRLEQCAHLTGGNKALHGWLWISALAQISAAAAARCNAERCRGMRLGPRVRRRTRRRAAPPPPGCEIDMRGKIGLAGRIEQACIFVCPPPPATCRRSRAVMAIVHDQRRAASRCNRAGDFFGERSRCGRGFIHRAVLRIAAPCGIDRETWREREFKRAILFDVTMRSHQPRGVFTNWRIGSASKNSLATRKSGRSDKASESK